MDYSEFSKMESGEIIFAYGIMLIFTIIAYCTIPTILRFTLIKKKRFSKNKLISIVVINALLVFFTVHIIDFIVSEGNYSSISFTPMILWSFINYLILYYGNQKYHKDDSINSSGNKGMVANNASFSYKTDSSSIANNLKNDNIKKNITEEIDHSQLVKTEGIKKSQPITTKEIDNNLQIDTSEVFSKNQINNENESKIKNNKDITEKIYTKKHIVTLSCIIGLLSVICVGISTYAFTEISNLNTELEEKEVSLSSYLIAAHSYVESAVIVKDGDNKYYHRINCPQLGIEYRYLTYNPEAAIGKGYSKCPICYELDIDKYIEKYF